MSINDKKIFYGELATKLGFKDWLAAPGKKNSQNKINVKIAITNKNNKAHAITVPACPLLIHPSRNAII